MKGADCGIHIDTPTRRKIDLAGTWLYSFDNEQWQEVKVPCSFDYEGQIIFQRKIAVDNALLSSFAFKFVALGINNDAEVFINDIFVGKHSGGYTTIEFDVPDNVLQIGAENVIRVVANNRLSARSTLPVRKQIWGWKNYGGILRDIYLLATPKLWIEDMRIHPELTSDFKQGSVKAEVTISNRGYEHLEPDSVNKKVQPVSFVLNLEIQEKLSEAVIAQSVPVPLLLEPNKDHEVQTSVLISSPRRWSPEAPEVYVVRAVITRIEGKQKTIVDEVVRNTGFRRLELAGSRILVNGEKRVLKGVVWHEDSPDHGASLTYAQMEKDIALVKTLGADAVRFAFHPPHPYLLNLCARYGLFAFVEVPVWNVAADILTDESFQLLAEASLREMVSAFHDSPSVLAWSIGSDFDSADPMSIFYVNRMVKFMKTLDDRPVYFGSRMIENDVASNGVDICAINIPSTDLKGFKEILGEWKKRYSNKPVFVLSYGKEVDHGNRQGWSDPMSQEHQARFFLQYYGAIKEAGVAGSFISAFADWRGDRPILTQNSSDPYVHHVGLMSSEREKRLSYDMVKILYSEEKATAIPVGSHRSTFPVSHVLSGLLVIIFGGYQYAYNRRFGEAVRRAFLRSFNFYADLRDLRAASVFHTLTLGLLISVTLADISSSILYHYRGDKLFDYIMTYVVVSDTAKEQLIRATWNPLTGILGFSIFFFLGSWVMAILIKVSSVFVRTKVRWFHAYSVPVWGALPIIFLSPVAMSMFKVMENPMYVIPVFVVIAIVLLWVLVRIFAGLSVIYDIAPVKSYLGGLLVGGILLGAVYFYYDSAFAIGSYLRFALNVARSVG